MNMAEGLLKHATDLLVCILCCLIVIAACQVLLAIERMKPLRVEARSEEIMKVDIVKVGGYYISKWEFLGGKK